MTPMNFFFNFFNRIAQQKFKIEPRTFTWTSRGFLFKVFRIMRKYLNVLRNEGVHDNSWRKREEREELDTERRTVRDRGRRWGDKMGREEEEGRGKWNKGNSHTWHLSISSSISSIKLPNKNLKLNRGHSIGRLVGSSWTGNEAISRNEFPRNSIPSSPKHPFTATSSLRPQVTYIARSLPPRPTLRLDLIESICLWVSSPMELDPHSTLPIPV